MVQTRNFTKWGDHSTTAVVKSMIQEALLNPLNEKFMLLSETCIPLYPPQVIIAMGASFSECTDLRQQHLSHNPAPEVQVGRVHTLSHIAYTLQVIHMQLIQEQKSRINACAKEGWERNFGRYTK